MAEIDLAVAHLRQAPGLCGAATAQMMLHFKGLAAASAAVQQQIFTDIQANTVAVRPTSNVRPHDCPSWPMQMCDRCLGEPKYTCWCSYPAALTATLIQRGLAVVETAHADENTAAAQVLDAVDRGFPPAVLALNGSHWVTITGYVTGTGPQDARYIGGRWVSDIYFNDPDMEDASAMPVATWFDKHLSPVILCGAYVNAMVVIADVPPPPHMTGSPPAGTAPPGTPAESGRPPRRPRRPRRPARPRHPPRPGPRRSRAKR